MQIPGKLCKSRKKPLSKKDGNTGIEINKANDAKPVIETNEVKTKPANYDNNNK